MKNHVDNYFDLCYHILQESDCKNIQIAKPDEIKEKNENYFVIRKHNLRKHNL